MDIDEFKYNYIHNNSNGIYSNERIIREKYNGIYNIIKDSILLDVSFKEKVYLFVNNKTKPVCECCGSSVKFINNKIGYRNTCSNSCSTKINRHKIKDKMIEKYGVDHHSKLPHVIDNNNKRKIDKIKNIVGIDNYLDFNNNIVKYKCDKCNKVHETVYQVYRQRIQLGLDHRDCVTGYMNGKSNGEKELQEYIQSVYNGKIMLNDRKVLNGSELDIYLPELGLAFEFNGLYWHSELHKSKSYHYDKWFNCKNRSIDLIQIYEDEWIYKREIVESRIKSVLGIIDNKIYARKCEIRQLEYKECKDFLDKNHLQGSVNSKINIGLFYNNELVSLMTFGKPRKALKYKSDNTYIYEIYRFCNRLNYQVIGGASKMFKYFINKYQPEEVYSFSSIEWPGLVYEKIGMELKSISKESYWFINGKNRISRHTYNKQNLVKMGYDKNLTSSEIIKQLKLIKIYGPGNKRYVWNKSL